MISVGGSYDKTTQTWNANTDEAVGASLQGHTGSVLSVAISPDGKLVVSSSDYMTIRVWRLEFFIQSQFFELPAIHLSSNSIHALCSAPSFPQDRHTPVPLVPNEEGWVVGPDDRLLLWIPNSLYPVVGYLRSPTMACSHFAHGPNVGRMIMALVSGAFVPTKSTCTSISRAHITSFD